MVYSRGWTGIYPVMKNAEPYEGGFPDIVMDLQGAISSGLGRAHVFMAQRHYQDQFKKILESSAWPGTLNVDLYEECIGSYNMLRVISGLDSGEKTGSEKALRIQGFEREGKSFGGATAFRAKISSDKKKWIDCAILIPDLTRHVKTAEIISKSFLREIMPCKNGDTVFITLI